MASTAVPGIINMRGAKTPHPKKSSKGFKWPGHRAVTPEQKKSFAIFLERKMTEAEHTHITLARHFWGVTTAGGTSGSLVAKWLRMEKFPSPKVADYLAQYFKASAEEMLQAKGEYKDPAHLIVNSKGEQPTGRGGAAAQAKKPATAAPVAVNGKRKYTKKTNGHAHIPDDDRWILPKGVEPPHARIETSKKNPLMSELQVQKATVPNHIAQAVYSMLNKYKRPLVEDQE